MAAMRSKLKSFGLFTFLIGCALIAAGLLVPKLVPNDKPIPLDLNARTLALTDPAATIGPAYQGLDAKTNITAPVIRQFNLTLEGPASEDSASARVGVTTSRSDVSDDLQSLLEAQIWSFKIDRISGEARGNAKVSDTPATPPADRPIQGVWAKFPQKTEQKSYDYFDVTLRRALPAQFTGTREVTTSQGEKVQLYVFRQDIKSQSVAESYPGLRNTVTVDVNGTPTQGFLHHSGWRELTVEPESGLLVGVEENIEDVYLDRSGKQIQDLLKFHGKTNQGTQEAMLEQALSTSGHRNTFTWGLALVVAGVIVAAASLVVVLWGARRRRLGRRGDIQPDDNQRDGSQRDGNQRGDGERGESLRDGDPCNGTWREDSPNHSGDGEAGREE